MQCDQCLHVINTAAKSYTPTNPVSRFPPIQELANAVWPLSSCNVHHINLTNSPLLQMVTLNQFYLVKGGPGIIALHSLLYIQSCRVTVFGISLCRISHTNLPLLLHVWYKSHQFAAVAVQRCHFSRLGGLGWVLPSEVLCLKTSPLTEGASGRCAAHSLLFVPLPKKYTPTCEGISYTKCSAPFAKTSSMQPSPHPMGKPSTSAPLI